MAEGKVSDLLNPADTLVAIETGNVESARQTLRQSRWNAYLQPAEKLVLKMHKNEIPDLARFLVDREVDVLAIRPTHSLEDYFLSLTTGNQHVAAYTN